MEVMTMSKSSISLLAKAIVSRRGLKQAEAERFITKMFEVANQGLDDDKLLKMKWLGTFKVTPVKDRESIDVNTGERIVIEGRDKITFTPDNILKEIVNKPFAQFETVVVRDGVDFSEIDEKFAKMKDEEEEAVEQVEVNAEELDAPLEEEIQEGSGAGEESADTVPTAVPEEESSDTSMPEEETSPMPEEMVAPAVAEDVKEIGVTEEQTPSVVEVESGSDESAVVDSASEDLDVPSENKVEIPAESKVEIPLDESVHVPSESKVDVPLEEKPITGVAEEKVTENLDCDRHHFVIPKYVVAIVCVAFVLMLGGMGWFAFSYGKMQAQRDQLAEQLSLTQKKVTVKQVRQEAIQPTAQEDSATAVLKAKAKQDSIRMAASGEAVKKAEMAEKEEKKEIVEKKGNVEKNEKVEESSVQSSKFNQDPRIRTGAYRIVGVAQTVTAKAGQTIAGLSKIYLGPGMECYIEALNGTSEIKEGQKVKIPKLELKKKSK